MDIKYYRIIASNQYLKKLGICYDLSGLVGKLNHTFLNGYYSIEVKYKPYADLDYIVTQDFHIPKEYLNELESK